MDASKVDEDAKPVLVLSPPVAAAVRALEGKHADIPTLVDALKAKGNELFGAQKYEQAAEFYSAAIDKAPSAVLHCNRAFAYLKSEAFGSAIADAEASIKLDPSFVKAYYRRGSAHLALGQYKAARTDFQLVVKHAPADKDGVAKLKTAEKMVKQQLFEEAIAMDHAPKLSDTLDVNTIPVPATYDGPRIPDSGIDLEFVTGMMEYQRLQKNIHKKYAAYILVNMKKMMEALPSMVEVQFTSPAEDGQPVYFNVCGDTHGQYYDTLNLFKLNGLPGPTNPYLFNGDYVDRGSFSVENALLLFAFKLLYPQHFHLTRGNHESKSMNRVYGFEAEVKAKYDETVMTLFTEVFNVLPLCARINEKVLVTHGGLPATPVPLADIAAVDRFREPPDSGLMSDLLWSDPQPFKGIAPSKRGVGVSFGPDVTDRFLKANNLSLLIRSHEVKEDGYLVEHEGKCITVFSAPNYCDQIGNKGGIVRLVATDLANPKLVSFEAVEHPPVRPMAYANPMSMYGL